MPYELFKAAIQKLVPVVDSDFDAISPSLKKVYLKKNEIWEKAGFISQNMGFVNSGLLRQYYLKDGNEFTDDFFDQGDWIGNYISYLSKEPAHTFTVAMEACDLWVMPFATVESFYKDYPHVELFSKKLGDQKLFELKKRSTSLLMNNATERYHDLVSERPDLFNRVPQYLIAQYLGIRPESLSRIRKKDIP